MKIRSDSLLLELIENGDYWNDALWMAIEGNNIRDAILAAGKLALAAGMIETYLLEKQTNQE